MSHSVSERHRQLLRQMVQFYRSDGVAQFYYISTFGAPSYLLFQGKQRRELQATAEDLCVLEKAGVIKLEWERNMPRRGTLLRRALRVADNHPEPPVVAPPPPDQSTAGKA